MRARVLCLVLALAALGGCQSTPPTPDPTPTTTRTSLPPLTPVTSSAITPRPGPDTPHSKVLLRGVVATPGAGGTGTPATDFEQALSIRQAPGIDDDPAARQAAVAATDCTRPDPLKGHDLEALPLAACNSYGAVYLLQQALLAGKDIAHAGYEFTINKEWVVMLSFTPEAARTWAGYPNSPRGQYALVTDGQVRGIIQLGDSIDGELPVYNGGLSEQQAHDLAAVINNH